MEKLLVFALIVSGLFLTKPELQTAKYRGGYCYGDSAEQGVGCVDIYPESDTTILFYISVNRGAPSYNMGQNYGRIKIKAGTGIYDSNGCRFRISFSKDSLQINTLDEKYSCDDFGYGVYSDGIFRKIGTCANFFIDETNDTISFGVDPDTWKGR